MTYTDKKPYQFVRPNFNAEHEAEKILMTHTTGVMSCTTPEFDTVAELWEFILDETGFILAAKWMNGEYNPVEYNLVRNALATLINGLFADIPWNVMDTPIK